MKMTLIFGSLFAVVLLLVSVGLFLHSESPHDRDLRECREGYGGSREIRRAGPLLTPP